ncbi:Hydroxyacylglutathione hydrolase GloC [Phycisphaerales bacterium]|nr:Hydroxyacylglutathione hydrolase GloC [Phycisphaerales bacterium]
MLLRTIYDDKLAQASYLLGCQRTGEAIVVDPQRDVDRYLEVANKHGLRIVAAAETHIHADFLSGVRELAERGVKACLSDAGDADWKYQWLNLKSGGGAYDHRLLKDGDLIRVGGVELKVIHTPGHTPEHLAFLVTDRGGGATEPMGVLSGDFVFVGDLGRPDLLESAAGIAGSSEPGARRLFHSARRFMELPDYLQVWPAHGAGSACGKALGAVPSTTVGYEKRFNPALRAAASERGFVDFILADQPEPPLYFARMKRDNKRGPRVLGDPPRPRAMNVDDLLSLDTRTAALIDTRAWDAFRKGHLPGALYFPLNNSFNTDAGSMIGEDERIYLIADGSRVEEAVRDLVRIGLDRIEGWFDPALLEQYASRGGRLATTSEIGVEQARALLASGRAFPLDVRRQSEFSQGHVPGARCIAHTRLASRLEEVPKDRHIVVNCRSGSRSARACALLQRRGYDVSNLAGGFLAWQQAGAAVE